jgi:hypothetical protein
MVAPKQNMDSEGPENNIAYSGQLSFGYPFPAAKSLAEV